jgi:hypothetical protein
MGRDRIRIRPRAMVTIAPASRSSATAGRFAARSAACWSDVRRSAERRRTTDGRVAPPGDGQELAEVAVSGDDDQGVGGGIVEDGPVGCREQPYVADVDGFQPGLAQGGRPLSAIGWRR